MTPTILRQLWSVIEMTQSNILLKLDDASLVQWLLKQTKTQALLDCNQTDILSNYIHSRLPLIRDLAQER
jgi:succinate dehydrogenase flavin-adding protein (antitoxin of CptAB toxin-antitoxin module)